MHHYDTLRGWDRLVNKAQEKTLKNFVLCLKKQHYYMLYTTAIPSCLPFTLICLKHPLVTPGTTFLSLGSNFIRRDMSVLVQNSRTTCFGAPFHMPLFGAVFTKGVHGSETVYLLWQICLKTKRANFLRFQNQDLNDFSLLIFKG